MSGCDRGSESVDTIRSRGFSLSPQWVDSQCSIGRPSRWPIRKVQWPRMGHESLQLNVYHNNDLTVSVLPFHRMSHTMFFRGLPSFTNIVLFPCSFTSLPHSFTYDIMYAKVGIHWMNPKLTPVKPFTKDTLTLFLHIMWKRATL